MPRIEAELSEIFGARQRVTVGPWRREHQAWWDIYQGLRVDGPKVTVAFKRWPEEIAVLGQRTVGKFSRCKLCAPTVPIHLAGTVAHYGGEPLCSKCAKVLAGHNPSPGVE